MRGTKITHWIERKPQRKTYTNTKKRIEKVKKKINRFRALNAQRAHTRQLLLYRCVCKLLKSFKNIWIEWTPSTEQILIVQRVGEGERERKKNPFKQSQHCELKLNNNILLTRNPSSPAWCFFPSSFPSLNRQPIQVCVYIRYLIFSFFILRLVYWILFCSAWFLPVSSSSISIQIRIFLSWMCVRVCAWAQTHAECAHTSNVYLCTSANAFTVCQCSVSLFISFVSV